MSHRVAAAANPTGKERADMQQQQEQQPLGRGAARSTREAPKRLGVMADLAELGDPLSKKLKGKLMHDRPSRRGGRLLSFSRRS